MGTINNVVLSGRLGHDAVKRETKKGKPSSTSRWRPSAGGSTPRATATSKRSGTTSPAGARPSRTRSTTSCLTW